MKRAAAVLMLMVCIGLLAGCSSDTYVEENGAVRQTHFGCFVEVERISDSIDSEITFLCYDKSTHVLYYIIYSGSRCGISPCWVWEEENSTFHVGHWPEDILDK